MKLYTLSIEFEGELAFEVFCDITCNYDEDDNYAFANTETTASVLAGSRVSEAERRTRLIRAIDD